MVATRGQWVVPPLSPTSRSFPIALGYIGELEALDLRESSALQLRLCRVIGGRTVRRSLQHSAVTLYRGRRGEYRGVFPGAVAQLRKLEGIVPSGHGRSTFPFS
jgi:hypothetical protein